MRNLKTLLARLALVVVLFYGAQLLIWPLIGDQVVTWFEAKIRALMAQ